MGEDHRDHAIFLGERAFGSGRAVSPVQMAEYSVAEALTIANVLKAFVEQSAAAEIEELGRKVREAAEK